MVVIRANPQISVAGAASLGILPSIADVAQGTANSTTGPKVVAVLHPEAHLVLPPGANFREIAGIATSKATAIKNVANARLQSTLATPILSSIIVPTLFT